MNGLREIQNVDALRSLMLDRFMGQSLSRLRQTAVTAPQRTARPRGHWQPKVHEPLFGCYVANLEELAIAPASQPPSHIFPKGSFISLELGMLLVSEARGFLQEEVRDAKHIGSDSSESEREQLVDQLESELASLDSDSSASEAAVQATSNLLSFFTSLSLENNQGVVYLSDESGTRPKRRYYWEILQRFRVASSIPNFPIRVHENISAFLSLGNTISGNWGEVTKTERGLQLVGKLNVIQRPALPLAEFSRDL